MMTDNEILDVAHRMAWRYKMSSDPHHSDTYTFNATTMVDFARRVMAAAASEENREYYCKKHAPAGFFTANEPPWPFWKCEACGHQAHGWVVRSNVEAQGRQAAASSPAGVPLERRVGPHGGKNV